MNSLNAIGRLGKDCETRFTTKGDAITSFALAIDSGYGENKITTWLNCSMFGKRGESVAPYLKKGGQVAVSGELTNRPYTDKSGNERFSLDVRVNDLTLIGGKPDGKSDAPKPEAKPAQRQPGEDDGFDGMEDDSIPF